MSPTILYKDVDKIDGKEYWIKEEVATFTVLANGFVEVIDKNSNEFILPPHMIGKIERNRK